MVWLGLGLVLAVGWPALEKCHAAGKALTLTMKSRIPEGMQPEE
jgi:hypothetical protein